MKALSIEAGHAQLQTVSKLSAEELKSGIEVDGTIGPYRTTKVVGCEDGVEDGSSLCYTCKLGARPVAFIFAKNPDNNLATLIKELDKVAGENSDAKMAAVVNFNGELTDDYIQKIKEFGE